MAIQEQVLKANPSVLHNQSLSMARQRALTMQALAVPAAQNISTRALTLLFPRGAAILCAAARQRVLPKAPRSQVLHSGERRPLAAAARGTGARQQPGDSGADGAPCPAALTCDSRGRSALGISTRGVGQVKQIMIMRL